MNVNFVEKEPVGKLEDIVLKEDLKQSVGWFYFETSLSAAHQLIRHRKLNKKIVEIGDGYVVPGSIRKNEEALKTYKNEIEKLFNKNSFYDLPNATIVKIRGHEDLYTFIDNIISLRTCTAAQWK